MEVSRISPAPRSSALLAHSTASMPVDLVPPWVKTSQWSSTLLPSMATTTHCLPKLSAHSEMMSGFFTAAELTDTLSAPALRASLMSSTLLIPPPTVRGTNSFPAVSETMSSMVCLVSREAVMSRNVISSAPWSS